MMVLEREVGIAAERKFGSSLKFFCFSFLFIFSGVVFIQGCAKQGGQEVDSALTTASEVRRAKLYKSIERDFEDSDAHYQLGKLYHSEGRYAKAETEYQLALSFSPAHRNAQAAMVKVLGDEGEQTRSEFAADMYINQASGSAVEMTKLALAFQGEGLDEYALRCYRMALDKEPNSAKINRQIGYYYLSKGDRDRGREYLKRSFQINHNQPEVAGQLGRLGVEIRIPRSAGKKAREVDQMVEQSDKELTQ